MIKSFLSELENSSLYLGDSKVLSNGTRLVGKKKFQPGDSQYLHTIFGPLAEEEIDVLQSIINKKFPEDLKNFYRIANGLYIFSRSLSIRGLRKIGGRDLNDNAWQPESLEYGNNIERPSGANDDMIFFGTYSLGNGYEIYMSTKNKKVFVSSRNTAFPVLYEWKNIDEMISSEIKRMSYLFRINGFSVTAFDPFPPPRVFETKNS